MHEVQMHYLSNMAGAVCTGHDALISTAGNDKSCAPNIPGAHSGMPVGRATQDQGQCALATLYQPSLQAQTCVDAPVTHVNHPPSRWLQFVTTCRCLKSTQTHPSPLKRHLTALCTKGPCWHIYDNPKQLAARASCWSLLEWHTTPC